MQIASVPRREGETAFPEVATILEALRGIIRSRKAAENDEGVRWAKYVEQCKAEGISDPDAVTLKQIEALNEKYDLKKPKEIVTVHTELACHKCGAVQAVPGNTRFWTAEQHREHADVLDELAVIAERNRSMSNLPLGDVFEAVSA